MHLKYAAWLLFAQMLAFLPVPAQAAESALAFSGSFRARMETLEGQYRAGFKGSDQALHLRTLVDIRWQREQLTAFLELQDSRNYLNDSGSWLSTININALEPIQLGVSLRLNPEGGEQGNVNLIVGRQTIDLGGRRLVARNRFRNTIQSYTGWRLRWQHPDFGLELFHVLPVLVLPDDNSGMLRNRILLDQQDADLQFWGVFHSKPLAWPRFNLESYLFGLHETDGPQLATADRELYTPGFRLYRTEAAGSWDMELELVRQWGKRRAGSNFAPEPRLAVDATFVHAGLGYVFDAPLRPRIALEFDGASGNRADAGERYRRFDSLFGPRRADLNPTGIYGILGRENILSWGARFSLNFGAGSDLFLSLRQNRLHSAVDTFARTGVRDPGGASGKDAGLQLETRYRRNLLGTRLRLEAGAAWFQRGEFLEQAPNANQEGDSVFVYSDVTWQF